MATVVNNQETNEGDNVFYIDTNRQIHEAVIKSIVERDGNYYAEVSFERDGKKRRAIKVPHNTSPERHTWNHPLSDKERETHYKEDFYGELPLYEHEEETEQEANYGTEIDYSALEYDDTYEQDEEDENA